MYWLIVSDIPSFSRKFSTDFPNPVKKNDPFSISSSQPPLIPPLRCFYRLKCSEARRGEAPPDDWFPEPENADSEVFPQRERGEEEEKEKEER